MALNLSLKGLLGSRYLDFVDSVVYPRLEELVEAGSVSEEEVGKLRTLVSDGGLDILDPKMNVFEGNTLHNKNPEEYILEVALPLAEDANIRYVIKKFANKKEFNHAFNAQKRISKHLEGTRLEGRVPYPEFVNRKNRIIITPYVHGVTLKEALDSTDDKENLLRDAIDNYVDLFNQMGKPKISWIPWLTGLKFPKYELSMEEYFGKSYSPSEDFMKVFREEIAKELQESRRWRIHGDLHAKNILVNGEMSYIDWERAVADGYPELDLGKLLTKADLDEEEEERLVRYAACQLFESEDEQEAAVRRFTKNQIAKELISAQYYLEGAKGSNEAINMASVWYNSAIRRTRKAVGEGILSEGFLEELLKDNPEVNGISVSEVSDEEYVRLRREYNPNVLMSQENMYNVAQPLTELVNQNPRDSLASIRRVIKKAKFWRGVRRILSPILALGGLAGILGVRYNGIIQAQRQMEEAVRKAKEAERKLDERSLDHIQYLNKELYQREFSIAYRKLKTELIEGNVNTRLPLDSPRIKETAEKYDLEEKMIINMLEGSKYYAGGPDWGFEDKDRRLIDVRLFDPLLAANYETAVLDPWENLDQGAVRLRSLIDKHNGDIKKALVEFYIPFKYLKDAGWINDPRNDAIKFDIARLVYSAMHGLDSYYDLGAVKTTHLGYPPKDFNLD